MNIKKETQRIAKNSFYLYIRMLFTMSISFYTSRIILNTLGVEDFGVYNVVGGITAMFSFFNGSLQAASSRFLTFAIGKRIEKDIKETFSCVLGIHLLLALIILFLSETIGLWFVTNKLVIPQDRYTAALWVYQCSIITMIVSIISVPYNSLIIAHEKMNIFAYISIIESFFKLSIVLALLWIPFDKLITYSVLYLIIQIILRIIYSIYCAKHFQESLEKPRWDSKKSKELAIYAGWSSNGNLALIANNQGLNVLLNLFFGPIVNAARGLATQIQGAVLVFVQNYQMALSPPIIKAYATNDFNYMHKLLIASSKYGYLVMILIVYPLYFFTPLILKIWLGIVPEYTINFVRITLLVCLIAPLRQTMINAIHATGIIKKFQLYEGTTLLMVIPLSYIGLILFKISPEMVMIIYAFIEVIAQCIRTYIVLPLIKMSFSCYLKNVLIRPLLVTTILFITILFLPQNNDISYQAFIYISSIILFDIFIILSLGLTSNERHLIFSYLKNWIK